MDKNQKFLRKLHRKEFDDVQATLLKLNLGLDYIKNLDVKKLSGYKDIYSVRINNIRIIFLADDENTEVLEISRRNEKTYKNF